MQNALRHDQIIRSVLDRNGTFSMYSDKIANNSSPPDTESLINGLNAPTETTTTALNNNTQSSLKLEKTQLLNDNLLRQWSIHADSFDLFDEPLMTWEQVEPELDRVLGMPEDQENLSATRIPAVTDGDEPGLDDSGISAVLRTIYSADGEKKEEVIETFGSLQALETEDNSLQKQDNTKKVEHTIKRSVLNEVKNVHSDKNSIETVADKGRKHGTSKSRASGKRTRTERTKRKANAYKRKKRVYE